jgi:hypothetical protein
MKTARIEGTQPSMLDARLLSEIGLAQTEPHIVWQEKLLIGIRNEDDQLYRAMGFSELNDYVDVVSKLRMLGYTDTVPDACETELGFDAIVSPPLKDRHQRQW